MTSSFDKNNLGKEPFALEMGIHWDKRTRGYQDYRREHTQKKVIKKYGMHVSKAYACPIVKGNSFGIFRISETII